MNKEIDKSWNFGTDQGTPMQINPVGLISLGKGDFIPSKFTVDSTGIVNITTTEKFGTEPTHILSIQKPFKSLLKITKDGRVESTIEDASEAGKLFVDSIRINLKTYLEQIESLKKEKEQITKQLEYATTAGNQWIDINDNLIERIIELEKELHEKNK